MVDDSKRRRRTRRETRRLMLEAGAELALEAVEDVGEGPDPLPHVRLADVAERATEIVRRADPAAGAITTGSIYPIWSGQAAYQRDLLGHLLEADHLGITPEWSELADYLERTDDDVHAAVARLASIGWEHARANAQLVIVLSQVTLVRDPELHQQLIGHYQRVWDQLVPAFQLLCSRFGYRLRPGGTFADFVRSAVALLDGLTLQYQIEPDELDERDAFYGEARGERWTLAGVATAALFDVWFETDRG